METTALTQSPTEQQGSTLLDTLLPKNFEQALSFADMLAKSDLVPKEYRDRPANVLVAMQHGAEIGLSPMQALQSLCVINGRPSIWGDGALALVQGSGLLAEHNESESTSECGVCEVRRKGEQTRHRVTFSIDDAKRAGLWGKQGPWSQYPSRMLKLRARGFALRDKFSDVLKGVAIAEDIIDITPVETTQSELQKPITQEEKGASVREKMLAKSGKPKEADATTGEPPPTCMTEQEAASMLTGTTTVEDCQAVWTDLFKTFVKDQPKDVKARLSKVYTDRVEALEEHG